MSISSWILMIIMVVDVCTITAASQKLGIRPPGIVPLNKQAICLGDLHATMLALYCYLAITNIPVIV